LDECDNESTEWLSAKLVDLSLDHGKTALRLTIVSRDIVSLKRCTQVKLNPDNTDHVRNDIRAFVSSKVQELALRLTLGPQFRKQVEDVLLERAAGTFLWVGFAMIKLFRKKTWTEVEEALQDLPKGLFAIYSRMLLQIPPSQRHVCSLILRWVTIAVRPLSVQELAAAVGCRATGLLSVEQVVRDKIRVCEPFITEQQQEISLVHQSARDYLLRADPGPDPVVDEFRVEPEEAHLLVSQICLEALVPDSPLYGYAMRYWSDHARRSSALMVQLLETASSFFRRDSPARDAWWRVYSEQGYLRRRINQRDRTLPPRLPRLHMACYLGMGPWARELLATERYILNPWKPANRSDSKGRTPLWYAIFRNDPELVTLLLEEPVLVDATVTKDEGHKQTALQLAASWGFDLVVRALLQHGANIDIEDNLGDTVLFQVVKHGHLSTLRTLLEHEAKNESESRPPAALFGAARRARDGRQATTPTYLVRGRVAEDKNKYGQTLLHVAIEEERPTVVQMLLDFGADVEVKDCCDFTALHEAVHTRHVAIVRMLLEHGARVEAKDHVQRTALHIAADWGREAIVRILLEHGVNVEARDENQQTVLHRAADWGREVIVETLLEHGANVEAKDVIQQTALHEAAWGGHEPVMRLLLERGADPNAENSPGKTARQVAAKWVDTEQYGLVTWLQSSQQQAD